VVNKAFISVPISLAPRSGGFYKAFIPDPNMHCRHPGQFTKHSFLTSTHLAPYQRGVNKALNFASPEGLKSLIRYSFPTPTLPLIQKGFIKYNMKRC